MSVVVVLVAPGSAQQPECSGLADGRSLEHGVVVSGAKHDEQVLAAGRRPATVHGADDKLAGLMETRPAILDSQPRRGPG